MGKKENKNNKKIRKELLINLREETKKTIVGIICFGVAILVFLSFFRLAGPFGEFFYNIFHFLFGWVYFFLPVIFILAGGIFVGSLRNNIYLSTVLGLLLFSLGLLGLSDIVKPFSGGWIGDKVGLVEKVFGFWGGAVFCLVLLLVGLVVVFEWSLRKEKKEKEVVEEEKKAVIVEPIKEVKIKTNGGIKE